MKIVRKNRHAVAFCSLKIGDQFERDGDLYVKTSLVAKDHNTIRLSNPCRVVRFAFTDYVHPVEIELHVFDKGETQ